MSETLKIAPQSAAHHFLRLLHEGRRSPAPSQGEAAAIELADTFVKLFPLLDEQARIGFMELVTFTVALPSEGKRFFDDPPVVETAFHDDRRKLLPGDRVKYRQGDGTIGEFVVRYAPHKTMLRGVEIWVLGLVGMMGMYSLDRVVEIVSKRHGGEA